MQIDVSKFTIIALIKQELQKYVDLCICILLLPTWQVSYITRPTLTFGATSFLRIFHMGPK